jgi:hypothetical protein
VGEAQPNAPVTPTKPRRPRQSSKPQLAPLLETLGGRIAGSGVTLKPGIIAIQFNGDRTSHFHFDCRAKAVRLVKGKPASERRTLISISGGERQLRAIFAGNKDPVKQFLAGGMRVRGDLPYLSDLAMAIGVLKRPL